jgi:oligosaccharide repeat unit polymerase
LNFVASNKSPAILRNTNWLLAVGGCGAGAILLIAAVLWVLVTKRELTQVASPGLFLACAVLSAVIARRAHGDLFSPVVLMALGWVAPVVLYSLDLSPTFLGRLRADTWWIIIGTLVLFNAGCFIAIQPLPTHGVWRGGEKRSGERLQTSKPKEAWGDSVLYGYFVLGLSGWIYRVLALGGLSAIVLLSDEPDFVRWQQLPRIIGQLPVLLLIVPLLCLVRLERGGVKEQKLLWLLAAVCLATSILDTARSNFFQVVFVGILFWTLRRGKIRLKTLAAVAACCLLLFVLVSWQRANFATGDSINRVSDEVNVLRPLALPYIYLTTSLANLQPNFDEGRRTFDGGGVRTFMPILSWLQIYKPLQIGNYLSDWPGGISLYQADLWIDFGWTGLLLGPLILGLICGKVYRAWRLRGTSFHTMMYAVLAMAVIASGFVNWFNSSVTWFFLFLIPPALWRPQASRVRQAHDSGKELPA